MQCGRTVRMCRQIIVIITIFFKDCCTYIYVAGGSWSCAEKSAGLRLTITYVGDGSCDGASTDLWLEGSYAIDSYELKSSGTCDIYIKTKEECEEAATILGLSDTSAGDAEQAGPHDVLYTITLS